MAWYNPFTWRAFKSAATLEKEAVNQILSQIRGEAKDINDLRILFQDLTSSTDEAHKATARKAIHKRIVDLHKREGIIDTIEETWLRDIQLHDLAKEKADQEKERKKAEEEKKKVEATQPAT